MTQPFQQANLKSRTALLLFIKGSSAPLILYFDNPAEVYLEIQSLLKSGMSKLIEKEALGPIKKVCLASNQISAVALQEETYYQQ